MQINLIFYFSTFLLKKNKINPDISIKYEFSSFMSFFTILTLQLTCEFIFFRFLRSKVSSIL